MSQKSEEPNSFGGSEEKAPSGALALLARFDVPPFSTLNADDGDWQKRKRAWLALGIKSDLGRKNNLQGMSNTILEPDPDKRAAMIADGEEIKGGTSIFDPVLCELMYSWFCPAGGQIVDPFAGGSVRGIVAGAKGYKYWGCDLSADQIAENRIQAVQIAEEKERHALHDWIGPEWVNGDSRTMVAAAPEADFVFSCPPYFNLENYSDDPCDISGMTWPEFLKAYREIVALAVARLKQDSFACFVVGDIRDAQGIYRNFVSETIAAFVDAGCGLYNEGILVTPSGTAPLRARRIFEASRKMTKTHQNVLVFCKGDPEEAAEKIKHETSAVA